MRRLPALFLVLAAACATPDNSPIRYTRGSIKVLNAPHRDAKVVRQTAESERVEYNLVQGDWLRLIGNPGVEEQWAHEGVLLTPKEEMARRCHDAVVRVEAWKWTPKGEDVTATGEVTNISTKTLKAVAAKVEYRDASGTLLSSESQLIDSESLPPGQSITFKVISPYKDGMMTANVLFADLKGAEVPSCRRP